VNKVEQASDKIFKTQRGRGSQLFSTGWLVSVHPTCQILLVLLVSLLCGKLLLVSGGGQNPGSENALMMACWFLVLAGIAGTLLIGNGISWGSEISKVSRSHEGKFRDFASRFRGRTPSHSRPQLNGTA